MVKVGGGAEILTVPYEPRYRYVPTVKGPNFDRGSDEDNFLSVEIRAWGPNFDTFN